MTYINLAVEDELSRVVMERIVAQTAAHLRVGRVFMKQGSGYLEKNIRSFSFAARYQPFVVLRDLDRAGCAPDLLSRWKPEDAHPNLLVRVAVREIESWVMADRESFADFIGISIDRLPHHLDDVSDPKQYLLRTVKGSRRRSIRRAILPAPGAQVGRQYNAALSEFVRDRWSAPEAQAHSDSLSRAVRAILRFRPLAPPDQPA